MLSNEDDAKLNRLLREWRVGRPLPRRFSEGVWLRIVWARAAPAVSLWRVFSEWVESSFHRPALVVAYVALLLVVGVVTGYWQAQGQSAQAQARWRSLYVQSVDPYQAPRD